ncbi:Alba, DNA/RNA-binding protein, archaeal, partial [mine drainage metagenome]
CITIYAIASMLSRVEEEKMPEEYQVEQERRESHIPENVVLVGKKPPMNYVLAVVTQFNSGVKSVKIRARGNAISRAVDVAEIARNRFITDAKVNAIAIGSEEISNEDGTRSKVSSIEITLAK